MRLPRWMLPSRFLLLERLPLLPSGKLDRRGLPLLRDSRPLPSSRDAGDASGDLPGDADQRLVAEAVAQVLGRPPRIGAGELLHRRRKLAAGHAPGRAPGRTLRPGLPRGRSLRRAQRGRHGPPAARVRTAGGPGPGRPRSDGRPAPGPGAAGLLDPAAAGRAGPRLRGLRGVPHARPPRSAGPAPRVVGSAGAAPAPAHPVRRDARRGPAASAARGRGPQRRLSHRGPRRSGRRSAAGAPRGPGRRAAGATLRPDRRAAPGHPLGALRRRPGRTLLLRAPHRLGRLVGAAILPGAGGGLHGAGLGKKRRTCRRFP